MLSVQRMSVAASTSRPGRSACFACRLSAITRWLAWKSDWMRPEGADLGIRRGGAPDDLEHRGDPELDHPRVARHQSQLARRIGFLDQLAVPRLLGDRHLVTAAAQQVVPERAQEAALGLEADVHRLERDARLGGDRLHGRGGVAALLEQALGGGEDVVAGDGGLRPPARGIVAARALDRLGDLRTLALNSLLSTSSQNPWGCDVTAGTEQLRTRLHEMWAAVAPAWAAHASYADARGLEIGETMLDRTGPVSGERVLELACGPGGLGLAAAARVAPGGEVVFSDVAAEMTAIAARRASAAGLTNVSA